MKVEKQVDLVHFKLDASNYAIPVSQVTGVEAAVFVNPLPGAPPSVKGVINWHGRILPVYNLRYRFSLPDRDIGLDDQFLVVVTERATAVLIVDEVVDLVNIKPEKIPSDGNLLIDGVYNSEDGLVLIHDVGKFLSSEEVVSLDGALAEHCHAG